MPFIFHSPELHVWKSNRPNRRRQVVFGHRGGLGVGGKRLREGGVREGRLEFLETLMEKFSVQIEIEVEKPEEGKPAPAEEEAEA